ncbi:MAG: CMP deaminase [Pseudomonadota bacterium]|nr:CMP deaminase [Pseudomonadota bacterium]
MFTLPTPVVAKKGIRDTYLKALRDLQKKSDDPDTQMTAIILSKDLKTKVSKANAMPLGILKDAERLVRPEKYHWIEHAERNAIYDSAKYGLALNGATMFALCMPCIDCARGIACSGIKRLYIDYDFTEFYIDGNAAKWEEGFKRVFALLDEAGVEVTFLTSRDI